MRFLVDANVLSEATKPSPDPNVLEWLIQHEPELTIDPIILGEIRFGIHLMAPGKRRQRLESWFEEGVRRIYCVPWEAATGLRWAELLARLRTDGQAMPIKDSMIAATALTHDFIVATRNIRDFEIAGVELLNPFS